MIPKFRAIIKEKNMTCYFTLYDLVSSKMFDMFKDELIPWLRAGNNPDLSTGLKDKNGREIFDGDIIVEHGTVNHTGSKFLVIKHEPPFFTFYDDENEEAGFADDIDGTCEVIGNVFENPELLGAEKDVKG